MGLIDKLFGNKKSTKYYNDLGLEHYGFTAEEKRAICGYYDHYFSKDIETGIAPIIKTDFDKMGYYRAYLPDVCLLWSDGQSNYAGVYYTGPLRGKVMFLSHDKPNHAPLFRDISSFLHGAYVGKIEALLQPEFDDCDYPARNLPENEKKHNLELAKQFLDSLASIDDKDKYFQAALKAIYLIPADNLDLLLPLFHSDNKYVLQNLPNIFAFHEYKAAIPMLQEVAKTGNIYIQNAARQALDKLFGD